MQLFARVAILLLFVAPPSLAQIPQPGWDSDARTGCKVWFPFNGPSQSVMWSGPCQNGVAQGRGVLTYANGDRLEGEFRDGKLNGWVVVTYANGDRYGGLWRDGSFIQGTSTAATQGSPDGRSPASPHGDEESLEREGLERLQRMLSDAAPHRDEIPLEREGGVLVVPVRINSAITLNFTIDSGAADVSIPADVVMTLFRTKTLTESDFLGSQIYRLADGSTVPSQTFRIRVLKVGNHEIENVTGSVAGVQAGLLLGQSFLSRFKSWSVDNQRQMLVLE